MKYKFVACMFNMKLETRKNRGISVFPGGRISNGSQMLSEVLSKPAMQQQLGFHSLHEFENSVYAYFEGELTNIKTEGQMHEIGMSYTFFHLRQFQAFSNRLWEVKDHNIYLRDGYILASNDNFKTCWTYKASLSSINHYADCRDEESLFSDKEMLQAATGFEPHSFDDYEEEEQGGKTVNSDLFFKNKGTSRILRANYFTLVARGSAIVPIKIVNYCNALECLFTIGTSEVTHKIAERAACLISMTEEGRREIFELIKSAYKYRSTLVHGQYLKKTEEELELPAISRGLDQLLRQLLVGNHEIFEAKDNEMEEFFTSLLFKPIVVPN